MKTTFPFIHMFILGAFLFGSTAIAQPPSFDLSDDQQTQLLAANLQKWEELNSAKATLEKSFQTMDAQSYPERDERFWWNPFWQNSRQNQAQLANRLLLDIQMINQDISTLKESLLDQTTAYASAALSSPSPLSASQNNLWAKSDQWRIPILLNEPDWKEFTSKKLARISAELYQNRTQLLFAKQSQWKLLENYLIQTQNHNLPKNVKTQYLHWLKQVEKNLATLTTLMETLPNPDQNQ